MSNTPRITVYSHGVKIEFVTPVLRKVLYQMARTWTEKGLIRDPLTRRMTFGPIRTYLLYADQGSTFYCHRNQFEELRQRCAHENIPDVELIYAPDPVADDVKYVIKPHWVLNPEQVTAEEFITKECENVGASPLLMMPTGTGKTVTSVITAARMGKRIAVIVSPRYQQKWVKDIQDILEIDKNRICNIDSTSLLKRAIRWRESNNNLPDVFIFGLIGMTNFAELQELDSGNPMLAEYGGLTHEVCEKLGIGTIIIDEAHERPYAVYRLFCHLHVPAVINLSATFLTKNPMLKQVQSMMFPRSIRFEKIQMKKYINITSLGYQIERFYQSRIETTARGDKNYSHVAFENSMLKNKVLLPQYLDMISGIFQDEYIGRYIQGDKIAIFVATEKMAKRLVHHLKTKHPKYDIRTKLYKDPYTTIFEADVIVTTIQSCGTAVDIPKLRSVLLTNSIDSPNANAQVLGRLRELKDRDVHFFYLYCIGIEKQVEYHQRKREVLEGRFATFKDRILNSLSC